MTRRTHIQERVHRSQKQERELNEGEFSVVQGAPIHQRDRDAPFRSPRTAKAMGVLQVSRQRRRPGHFNPLPHRGPIEAPLNVILPGGIEVTVSATNPQVRKLTPLIIEMLEGSGWLNKRELTEIFMADGYKRGTIESTFTSLRDQGLVEYRPEKRYQGGTEVSLIGVRAFGEERPELAVVPAEPEQVEEHETAPRHMAIVDFTDDEIDAILESSLGTELKRKILNI